MGLGIIVDWKKKIFPAIASELEPGVFVSALWAGLRLNLAGCGIDGIAAHAVERRSSRQFFVGAHLPA